MSDYVAKRIRFRNGERLSVLLHGGVPVHLAVLFLNRFRTKGRAANTIHQACTVLALLHNDLGSRGLDLWQTLCQGRFLSLPDLNRYADAAQYKVADLDDKPDSGRRVVSLEKMRFKASAKVQPREPVDGATHALRIRYAHAYLRFAVDYVTAMLPKEEATQLSRDAERGLKALHAQIPRVSRRAKIGARRGLTTEHEDLLLKVIHPDSLQNPWKSRFVRVRNQLIVIILLAGGMRKGELLGLQVRDLVPHKGMLQILRRADTPDDARVHQPNTKTADREIPIAPALLRALDAFIRSERRAIKRARRIPQLFTSDEGDALSLSSLNQIFIDIRRACPDLPGDLTSHVMRHTWNERFSEHADAAGMGWVEEEKARAVHQGWAEGSKMGATYTRRHTERKGRKLALDIQEKLEGSLNGVG